MKEQKNLSHPEGPADILNVGSSCPSHSVEQCHAKTNPDVGGGGMSVRNRWDADRRAAGQRQEVGAARGVLRQTEAGGTGARALGVSRAPWPANPGRPE